MNADDYFKVQRLINIYFTHVDGADFDAAGALFDRAEMVYTATDRRIDRDGKAVADLMRSFVKLHGEDGRTLTHHHSGNIIIEPDGPNKAAASCSAVIFQATATLPLQPIAQANYSDRFACNNGDWYFVRREMQLTLTGVMSEHLQRPA